MKILYPWRTSCFQPVFQKEIAALQAELDASQAKQQQSGQHDDVLMCPLIEIYMILVICFFLFKKRVYFIGNLCPIFFW